MAVLRDRAEFVALGLTFRKVGEGIYRCEKLPAEVHGEYGEGGFPFTFCRVSKRGEREWYARAKGARLPVRYTTRKAAATAGLRRMMGWSTRNREAMKDHGADAGG